jgi:hypothetical protein
MESPANKQDEVQKLLANILELQKSILRLLYSSELADEDAKFNSVVKDLEASLKMPPTSK